VIIAAEQRSRKKSERDFRSLVIKGIYGKATSGLHSHAANVEPE
jgi:hypothetical protein